jgi:hypothetical protein
MFGQQILLFSRSGIGISTEGFQRWRPSNRRTSFLRNKHCRALTQRVYVPGYIDYLFLAFTNATAFSPSDTFPLTARAKLLMMLQALISLITIALGASRAVGILA